MSISLPLWRRWNFQAKHGAPWLIQDLAGVLMKNDKFPWENQIKSGTYISWVFSRRRLFIYANKGGGVKIPAANGSMFIVWWRLPFGPATESRAFASQPQGFEQKQQHRGNLEYVTPAENVAHHFACLKGCQPSSKAVLSRAYGSKEEWTHHPSQAHAAETLGLHQTAVSKCARGLQNQTGGYEFRFAEPRTLCSWDLAWWRVAWCGCGCAPQRQRGPESKTEAKAPHEGSRKMSCRAAQLMRFVCWSVGMMSLWFMFSFRVVLAARWS